MAGVAAAVPIPVAAGLCAASALARQSESKPIMVNKRGGTVGCDFTRVKAALYVAEQQIDARERLWETHEAMEPPSGKCISKFGTGMAANLLIIAGRGKALFYLGARSPRSGK